MNQIYVKIVDSIPYEGTKEWYDVLMSEEEWNALDKTVPYVIDGQFVKPANSEPEPSTPPVERLRPLEELYAQNECGAIQQIDAMWDFLAFQTRDKLDALITKRNNVKKEYEELVNQHKGAQ